MNGFFILLLIISLLFSLQLVLAVAYFYLSKKANQKYETDSHSLTVIIPFRNEASRIKPLIESINKQQHLSPEIQFIFCNDHSTDNAVEIIQQTAKFPFQISELNGVSGKKAAIHQGVQTAGTDYILTLDADVILPEKYFETLVQHLKGDLIILPVRLSAGNIIQKLSSIEFEWLQKFTFGTKKPALCNGANLVFKKSVYLEVYGMRSDLDIASGDDLFLLQHMLNQNKHVYRQNLSLLEVTTPAPDSTSTLLSQRKRWIGKLQQMNTNSFLLPGAFLILIQLSFFTCLISGFFQLIFFLPLLLKFAAEALLISDGENKKLIPALIIHQFWYPIYLFRLLFPVNSNDRWSRSSKPA